MRLFSVFRLDSFRRAPTEPWASPRALGIAVVAFAAFATTRARASDIVLRTL